MTKRLDWKILQGPPSRFSGFVIRSPGRGDDWTPGGQGYELVS